MPQMPQMTATVAVKEVEERTYNLPEKFVAHAEAMQEVDLLPQVDGYIKETIILDRVGVGQKLGMLQPGD